MMIDFQINLILIFNLASFVAFSTLFKPYGAIFGVGLRFNNLFGNYLFRL